MQWFGRPFLPGVAEGFIQEKSARGVACVFGHSGYLINLGAPASANREKSIRALIEELRLAAALGLPFLVLHPGAHLGAGEEAGLRQIVAGLDAVIGETRGMITRIALENTAGQGSCLGAKLEHLGEIFARVRCPDRLAVCLDTAHLFEAGYDIRLPEGWNTVIDSVDRLVGIERVVAFHLNDSKTALGSRVDRHEHIGKGRIGAEAFRHIVNDTRFSGHPGCLETPKSADLHEDRENLALLRSLVARA
jgi:deoxyribonuclease-4